MADDATTATTATSYWRDADLLATTYGPRRPVTAADSEGADERPASAGDELDTRLDRAKNKRGAFKMARRARVPLSRRSCVRTGVVP